MSNIEKILILIVVVIMTISIYFVHAGLKKIESQGGIRTIIIETGKEIKAIRREINR